MPRPATENISLMRIVEAILFAVRCTYYAKELSYITFILPTQSVVQQSKEIWKLFTFAKNYYLSFQGNLCVECSDLRLDCTIDLASAKPASKISQTLLSTFHPKTLSFVNTCVFHDENIHEKSWSALLLKRLNALPLRIERLNTLFANISSALLRMCEAISIAKIFLLAAAVWFP